MNKDIININYDLGCKINPGHQEKYSKEILVKWWSDKAPSKWLLELVESGKIIIGYPNIAK